VALQRSGQSAAMMLTVRAPQSKTGDSRPLDLDGIHESDDIDSDRDGWPLRNASLERKRVEP